MPLAPIVLFVYNRPHHTRRLLESLSRCNLAEQSQLFVFADGIKSNASEEEEKQISEVRTIVKSKKWCMDVQLIERKNNAGLADSIVNGVSEVIHRRGELIVLEDDLVLAPGFLEYQNKALDIYRDEERVMHISGYMLPVKKKLPASFFMNATSCWGWATWKRAWSYYNSSAEDLLKKLDDSGRLNEYTFNGAAPFYNHLAENVNGNLKTWAIRWHTSVFLQKGFCLHPFPSLVRNTGNDGSGTHGSESVFNTQHMGDFIGLNKIPLVESNEARAALEKFYRELRRPKNIFERGIKKIFRSN